MPDLQAQLVIPPVSTGIGDARRFTSERLTAWGQDGLTDVAVLMISELVTNAILHGGEGAVLTLRLDPSKLRAEVRDSNPASPVVRGYSETATTGRGMVIVDALAAAWGTFPVEGGKIVWFELKAVPADSFVHDGEVGSRSADSAGTSQSNTPPAQGGRADGAGRPHALLLRAPALATR